MDRRGCLQAGAAAVATSVVGLAWAQAYPNRPIRWVVPYPAGGPVDAIGRRVAEALGGRLGQTIVIDNKGGASGAIGTAEVARASPDGYTFLLTITDTLVNNAALFRQLPYDPQRDFDLVTQIGASPVVMMANADIPARNVAELIAYAKRPGVQLSYGSWGPGSFPHLLGEALKKQAGIDMTHVPYRGAAPAIQDVVAKQVSVSFGPVNLASQLAQRGQVKPLALTGEVATSALPEVTTFVAQGFGGQIFRTRVWAGLAAPRGTPTDVIQRIVAELQLVLRTPEITGFIRSVGFDVIGNSPEEFRRAFAADFPLLTQLIRELNIELQ